MKYKFLLSIIIGVSFVNSYIHAQITTSIECDYRKSYAHRYLKKEDNKDLDTFFQKKYNEPNDIDVLKAHRVAYGSHSFGLSFYLHYKKSSIGLRGSYNRTGFRNRAIAIPDSVSSSIGGGYATVFCYTYHYKSLSLLYRHNVWERNKYKLFLGAELALNNTIQYIQDQYTDAINPTDPSDKGGIRTTIGIPLTEVEDNILMNAFSLGIERVVWNNLSLNASIFGDVVWYKFKTKVYNPNGSEYNYLFLSNPTRGYLYHWGIGLGCSYRLRK